MDNYGWLGGRWPLPMLLRLRSATTWASAPILSATPEACCRAPEFHYKESQMQCIAFAVPILPGKTEADRNAMRSVQADRKQDHESSRERHGISREAVWIQPTPAGDMAVVYLEADDLQAAFAGLGSSQEPFDRWFRETISEIHGIDLAQGFPPPEQILDYRRAG
jgi:hypothetical protein